jgi:glycosyltransferase involved in cell wall biosynthesis
MSVRRRVLVVEPYFGGSHRQFLEGLIRHVEADFVFLVLPARKWKMRMQLAAPWIIAELEKMPLEERRFDTLLASTFVDLGLLRALTTMLPGWDPRTRFCLYFHENQFAYPSQLKDPGFFQFTGINLNSALAADSLAFNSEFNRRSFLAGVTSLLKKAADMSFPDMGEKLRVKSRVIFPGITFDGVAASVEESREAVIVWNHRWEADKNPEEFFCALRALRARKVPFKLLLLGQSFRFHPACFDRVEEEFAENLLHCGFVESREEYLRLLGRGTVVVSTAVHEFYGIAVIEAVRAGCVPLLPARLSYPELFPQKDLYNKGELVERLLAHCRAPHRLSAATAAGLTRRFSWQTVAADYEDWLFTLPSP